MKLAALLVGVTLGVGCSNDKRATPSDAMSDATLDADPLVKCRVPPDCTDPALPACCVVYGPSGAFGGSRCVPANGCLTNLRTCDPNAAQPCTGNGVCKLIEFGGMFPDHRMWWACMCGTVLCPPSA